MKKLTTLFILLFIGAAVFAEPKIPEYTIKEDVVPFLYVSNDCQNVYEIYTLVSDSKNPLRLNFFNKSLVIPTSIYLQIEFTSKKNYDNFIKDIDMSDLEKSFILIRQKLTKQGVTPDIWKYNNGKTYSLNRQNDNTIYGYGYDEDFDWKNLPGIIRYCYSF